MDVYCVVTQEMGAGKVIISSKFRYFTAEAGIADAQAPCDCNIKITTQEVEVPSPYELAKYILCTQVEGTNTQGEEEMITPARGLMRDLMKALIITLDFKCCTAHSCNTVDIIHSLLSSEQIKVVIAYPPIMYEYVKSTISTIAGTTVETEVQV